MKGKIICIQTARIENKLMLNLQHCFSLLLSESIHVLVPAHVQFMHVYSVHYEYIANFKNISPINLLLHPTWCILENSHVGQYSSSHQWKQHRQLIEAVFTMYLGGLKDDSKSTKCVIQQFLINLWIKISNENVCTNIKVFVMRWCLEKEGKRKVREKENHLSTVKYEIPVLSRHNNNNYGKQQH